ncbi:MAG TPA: hypothetical protein VIW29_09680 [Polyangiaceae bacterium]
MVVSNSGSNDSTPPWFVDDTTGTKLDDPARRDSERNAANLAWRSASPDAPARLGAACW